MPAPVKKRNPTDLTLRNLRALRAAIRALETRIVLVERALRQKR